MAILLVSSQPALASTEAIGADPVTEYPTTITATATGVSSGSAAASVTAPAGGFADLAVCNLSSPDPAMSYIAGSDMPSTSSAWQQMSITATAPIDYERGPAGRLWNGAAYASVGVRFDALPASAVVAFDRVQFGQTASGNLLGREAAFYDGRMCYESGPGALVTRVKERPMVGEWSAKVAVFSVGGGRDGWDMTLHTDSLAPLKAGGGVVTARVSISTDVPRRWRVRVRLFDSSYNQIVDTLLTSPDLTSNANWVWSTGQVSMDAPSNAVYAAVTPYVFFDTASPQVGWYYYADGHYISYSSLATAYRVPAWAQPRRLQIRVKPARVNLLNNPGFNTGNSTWGAFTPPSAPFPLSWDAAEGHRSAGSAKYQVAAGFSATGVVGMGALSGVNPSGKAADMLNTGVKHTLSAWVKVPAGYPPVCAAAWDPLAAVYRFGPTSDWIKTNRPELVDGEWVRVYYQWTPPVTSTRQFFGGVMVSQGTYNGSSKGVAFWADDMLLEESPDIGDYFDGSDPSADYLWQGTANLSRSLYFPGRTRNVGRLTEILQDNVPWGTSFDLLFS
ncbi:hypothetical protein [Streptomyces sp. NPDC004528]|uniref:hypothetical protein n=1 Tax=Streptomyces sp. NPDC004528 TaxID=3154550 RepID=UPI0033B103B4